MPLRAKVRVRLEQVLRGVVIVALGLMLWQSLRPQTESGGAAITGALGGGALRRWSASATAPRTIQARLDSMPSPLERAWLAALRGAGSDVSWSGDLTPLMIDAQPIAAPTGGTRAIIATPRASPVVLADEIGPIDTVRPQNSGATLTLRVIPDRLTARSGHTIASTIQPDSVALRRVLVIGAAGWESKFTVAALEEEGWRVDALIRVAPGIDVTQGSPSPIDTAHYSAVIALDSTASPDASRIISFVRSGGGVILEPAAASLASMSALRTTSAVSLPIKGPASIAAKRIGAGRAIQIGRDDSWRMRMTNDDGVADHRRWWTELVSNVAYAPRTPRVTTGSTINGDPAPFADLVARIGPASSNQISRLSPTSVNMSVWLFGLLAAALIGEVVSRRTRGAA